MNVLENIIRKALFERKQRLNEAIGDWQYDGTWSTRFASKVAGAAPKSQKGFTVIAKGEKLPGELDQGIVTDIAKFLNFAVDVKPNIGIAPYNTGAYFIVLGKDSRVTRSETRRGNEINDAINGLAFPIDNIKDIIDNKFINYIATNAWKYPSAKGTAFETARSGVQNFSFISAGNFFGQSPLIVIGDLEELQADYKQLLPIAREMKNTPQPNGDMNRIDDINNAIESMESFLQDWPDWAALSKILSPKQTKQPRLRMTGLDGNELLDAEKWDGTDSKQAAALSAQSDAEQGAQSDASAIAAGTTIVDQTDKEYETADSPTGKITFTGQWNLETQQPIDGVATDEAGNKWEGVWNEKGQFITGTGYRKIGDGEWRGQMIKGFAKGYGEYKSPNIYFEGLVTNQNGQLVPVKGTINRKWQSETVPSKFESFVGEIVNSKWYEGEWTRYASESGKIAEYIFKGTFNPTTPETPKDGVVTKDGDYAKPYGEFVDGVFTKN